MPGETGLAREGRTGYASGMVDIVLSLLVLASLALVAGAWFVYRKGHAKQAGLMVLLAVIALVNVGIWTVPMDGGDAPLDMIEQGSR